MRRMRGRAFKDDSKKARFALWKVDEAAGSSAQREAMIRTAIFLPSSEACTARPVGGGRGSRLDSGKIRRIRRGLVKMQFAARLRVGAGAGASRPLA